MPGLFDVVGEFTVLDKVLIDVGELGDVKDFYIKVWVFEFEAGSKEASVS